MQVYVVVQKLKLAVNNGKDIYDQWRSFQELAAAGAVSVAALTDADLAPYGMTKAQFDAAAAGIDAMITAFDTAATDVLDIYG